MKRSFLILFLLISALSKVDLLAFNDSLRFSRLGIEQGLSQSTIHSIIQDHEGYLWFATSNGLNKYNGYTFEVYTNNPNDSSSISDNGACSLFEDKDGNLWIGTIKGFLNKYDRITDSFIRIDIRNVQSPIPAQQNEFYEFPILFSRNDNNSVTAIAEDNKGNLWLGTWGKGLLIFNKSSGEIKHYYHDSKYPEALSYNRIMRILIDREQNIWIGTFGGGLDKVSKDPNVPLKEDNLSFINYRKTLNKYSLADNKIISLMEDREGNIWIGTYGGGLNKLNVMEKNAPPSDVKFVHYQKNGEKNNIGNNQIMAILQDKTDDLWLGTFGGGLVKFDLKKNLFTHFYHDNLNQNSLAGNDVISLCQDSSGILWAGTHLGEGISKMEINKIKFGQIKNEPGNPNSLYDDVVWAILQDHNTLWIGTYRGGLNKYDRLKNKFYHYTHNPNNPSSLSDNHIRSLAEDKYGNIWVGTYSGGLNEFNPRTGRFKSYIHIPDDPSSIGANQVQAIHIDSNSNIWLGTYTGGLNKFKISSNGNDKIIFEHFLNDPAYPRSLSDNRVYSLFEDKSGVLWVGTFGGGLNKFNQKNKTFETYKNIQSDQYSLSDNRVISIYEDSDNNLWVGTYGGGLNKFDRVKKKFYRYKDKNELNCDVIYGILEDNNKNLWLSTDNGIFRFNIKSNFITHYDIQDGLQSIEFSGGAYFKGKDGEMFFGGINGLNYFYPDSIRNDAYIPPIVITQIKIFNKIFKGERKEITLKYDENFISFEFAALDYSNPNDNQYAYKLMGLENDWQYVNSNFRMATYTNLSPGKYTFIVKGSNSDRIWNSKGSIVVINILPPFWKTWWFISIWILVCALIIYYLSTIRIKNLLVIERIKTKLAADLHDNIGSGLTEISILSELAAAKLNGYSDKSSDELVKISDKARHLIDNMSDIIWVVNPKKDSLYDLIVRLKDSYSEFLESIGIRLKTSNLEKLEAVKLPMEFRQNLYLILKEGITNSIKHSNCRNISLDVNLQNDVIEIKLQDDGTGFILNPACLGNGIINMKNRAAAIGGHIQWEQNRYGGTMIHFSGKAGTVNKFKFRIKKIYDKSSHS